MGSSTQAPHLSLRLLAGILMVVLAVGACIETGGPGGPGTEPVETDSDPVGTLIDALASPDAAERREAVEALADSEDRRVGRALEGVLTDDDADVLIAAAVALADRGDTHAVPALVEALNVELDGAPDSDVLAAVATALGKIGGAKGVPALISLLGAGDAAGRTAGLKALAAIGDAALPALKTALADGDVDVRLAAVDGLGALGRSAVKALIGALGDDDAKVRSAAANRLGRIGDRSALKPLVALLDNPEWKTASIAVARLYAGAPTKLLPYLRADKTVRVYYGLIRLGSDTTVDALVDALRDLGDKAMAEDYLNCGNGELEQAARDWAADHGYSVTTVPGSGDGTWGSGLPD